MAGFKRVYTQFPGFNILGNIESVNTIDVPPPASPLGAGVGVVCLVGEFEKGPLNTPLRLFGGSDLESNFGGFGFTKDGEQYAYPVASQSGGSANPWNGNGFIALRNKRFSGLIVVRVDNSAGEVAFNRLACLTGAAGPYLDISNGDTLSWSVDGGGLVTSTFTGAAATLTGTGGTFPTLFVGGEQLELSIDGGPTLVVVFTDADQTLNQVIARINSTAAATIASDSGGQLQLASVLEGYSASIEVVGGNARATLGLPLVPVQQVNTVTINSNTGGGAFTLRTTITVDGAAVNYDATYTAGGGDTVGVVRDALLLAAQALGVPGITYAASGGAAFTATADANVTFSMSVVAEPAGGDMTFAATTPAVLTLAAGTGNVARLDLVSTSEAVSLLSALTGISAGLTVDGLLRVCATTTPGTGTLLLSPASTAAAKFGFTAGTTVSAASGAASTIPAGTRIRDTSTSAVWVTLEDIAVTAASGGPYTAKVRPAVDNDTTPTAAAGNLTEVLDVLEDGFVVSNAADINRLSGNQLDVRYLEAIDATLDVSGVPHDINIMYSARTSERIMQKIRANSLEATATGHRARKGIVAPPLGTSRADAKATSGVGVGNTGRDQRAFYCFPGLITYVPEIASKGAVAGGTGFTDDGVIQVRSDGFYASVASILPPEENRGQQLSDTNYGPLNALGLEDAYNKEAGGIGLTINDYIDFKANGIIAPRTDRVAGIVFQSDVTSVNPSTQPALVDAKRRFMGDFIIDSLSDIGVAYAKKLNTPGRRRAFLATINSFLERLQSPSQPETSRIEDFRVTDDTTDALRADGFQIVNVAVRIYPSMDYIVFRTTVGTTVNVEEIA